jgi:hypothetical protein
LRSHSPTPAAFIVPIQPGQAAAILLRSCRAGWWLFPVASGQQGMVCDQASPAAASVFTYTGVGLAHNGAPLVSTGPGQQLVLGGVATGSDALLSFSPAGEWPPADL